MLAAPTLISSEECKELLERPYLEVEELVIMVHPQKYPCQKINLKGEDSERLGRSYAYFPSGEVEADPLYQSIEKMINPGLYGNCEGQAFFSQEEGKFNPLFLSMRRCTLPGMEFYTTYEELPIKIVQAPRVLQCERKRKELRFIEREGAKSLVKSLGYFFFENNDTQAQSNKISHLEVAKRWVRIQSAATYFAFQYPYLRGNHTKLMEAILNFKVVEAPFSTDSTNKRMRNKIREVVLRDSIKAPPDIFKMNMLNPDFGLLNIYLRTFGEVCARDCNNKGDHKDLRKHPGVLLLMEKFDKKVQLLLEDTLIFAWASTKEHIRKCLNESAK